VKHTTLPGKGEKDVTEEELEHQSASFLDHNYCTKESASSGNIVGNLPEQIPSMKTKTKQYCAAINCNKNKLDNGDLSFFGSQEMKRGAKCGSNMFEDQTLRTKAHYTVQLTWHCALIILKTICSQTHLRRKGSSKQHSLA